MYLFQNRIYNYQVIFILYNKKTKIVGPLDDIARYPKRTVYYISRPRNERKRNLDKQAYTRNNKRN